MAIGDLWEVTLRSTLLGQECLNVFGYEETVELDEDVDGTEIGRWFWDKFETPLKGLVVDDLNYSQIDVLQITGGVMLGSYTIVGGNGDLTTGDPLPSFVAYGFRLNRASQASRHGYKRFAGVGEGQVAGNTSGVLSGVYNPIVAALTTPLTDPDTFLVGELTPRIISKVVNGQLRPVPLAFPISSVTFTGISSQNTRKP